MNLSDTDQAPCSTPASQTATVSDEAVQAALDKWFGADHYEYKNACFDDMLLTLTAALPHLALSVATCSVEVPEGWQLVPQVPTFEMAKAAIHLDPKSDLDAKYRAMLSAAPKAIAKPVDVAAVRRQAFEEITALIEVVKSSFMSEKYASPQPIGSASERFACDEILRELRALSAAPTSKGGE